MTIEGKRAHLRLVGGNGALARLPPDRRTPHWPPLRVVGASEADKEPRPAEPHCTVGRSAMWSQMLAAGLVLGLLSSVGQALAEYW